MFIMLYTFTFSEIAFRSDFTQVVFSMIPRDNMTSTVFKTLQLWLNDGVIVEYSVLSIDEITGGVQIRANIYYKNIIRMNRYTITFGIKE